LQFNRGYENVGENVIITTVQGAKTFECAITGAQGKKTKEEWYAREHQDLRVEVGKETGLDSYIRDILNTKS